LQVGELSDRYPHFTAEALGRNGLEEPKGFYKTVFQPLLQHLHDQLVTRMTSLSALATRFAFLTPKHLLLMDEEELKECCNAAAKHYKDHFECQGTMLLSELLALRSGLESHLLRQTSALQVPECLAEKDLLSDFPETVTALQLCIVLPVSVASNERSFSKLKLIQNFLSTTSAQERPRRSACWASRRASRAGAISRL